MAAGVGSQDLLITLIGTYFLGQDRPIPSVFLVRLLQEFDVSPVGARNGLSRLAARGLLVLHKPGRNTYYRLSPEAHNHHAERLSEIVNFGEYPIEWDGTWTVALFTVPEKERAQRHLVRSRLAALRFAMLYDGVWVRPGALKNQVSATLSSLNLQKVTVLSGAAVDGGFRGGNPVSAFALESLRESYEQFAASLQTLRADIDAGRVGAADALLQRARVMQDWRNFPDHDPLLPDELLPHDWPLHEARKAFTEVYDGLAELADHRFRSLLADYSTDLAGEVRSLTSAELLALHLPPKGLGPLTGMPDPLLTKE
ncbi:PaaX family transcriptional regulator C-terminal domain-containing protein [Pseudarthrobacter sp. fls2-241-R2A-168]|uniref:PaaX family transcriptional regulator n=1 Tax=Pseudarthrobacter sp. fls2-241-R2A-168 TaxID=3040304 RepID=UPI0025540D25|nr:PaaX family transcriptional regulator C-terminal domain-containing protein [Pseudarthrobacter sp. fls2-241-R2A-168]